MAFVYSSRPYANDTNVLLVLSGGGCASAATGDNVAPMAIIMEGLTHAETAVLRPHTPPLGTITDVTAGKEKNCSSSIVRIIRRRVVVTQMVWFPPNWDHTRSYISSPSDRIKTPTNNKSDTTFKYHCDSGKTRTPSIE